MKFFLFKMKKILIILLCLLLIGCKQEVIVKQEEPAVEIETPKPILLGVTVTEKTVHNYIVGAEPKGVFIVLDVEIANIGQEVVILVSDDITLTDIQNSYPVHDATTIYTKKQFAFEKINPGEMVEGKLVFDVPDSEQDYVLVVKDKRAIVD